MKNLILLFLVAAVAVLCLRLSHVENHRHALLLGMCRADVTLGVPDLACLSKIESRRSWLHNLYAGIMYL